jgi:hypothetical protein
MAASDYSVLLNNGAGSGPDYQRQRGLLEAISDASFRAWTRLADRGDRPPLKASSFNSRAGVDVPDYPP